MDRRQFVSAALALLAVGCGSSSTSNFSNGSATSTRNLVGRVQSTDFFIGLFTDGKRFFAYVCDGIRAQRFEGDLQADSGSVPDFTVTFQADNARGTVVIDGTVRTFTAFPAVSPAGLYWASTTIDGTRTFGGWILEGGEERGVVSSSTTLPTLANPVQQPSSSIIAILIGLRQPVTGLPRSPGSAPVTSIQDGTSNIKDGTSNT